MDDYIMNDRHVMGYHGIEKHYLGAQARDYFYG